MHGKISPVFHSNSGVFSQLSLPFNATRYHSLVIDKETLPECLEVTAWTEYDDGRTEEIMGVRHKDWVVEGVQFHPESILSEHGHDLLANFLRYTSGLR
jgi:anthranilate synthase component 2